MAVRTNTRRRQRQSQGATLLGFALIAAAIVVAAAFARPPVATLEAEAEPTIVAQFDTIPVRVPRSGVPAGTRVTEIEFETVMFPRHQIPHGAILDIEPYQESFTTAPLPARLPLFPENFSAIGSVQNPVIDRIPQGMRAMTIRVDATSAVEGWAGSGSVVDVLLIQQNETTVVAERVKILSAERQVTPVGASGSSPQVPSTVTLLVTQEQCLAINTAIPLGRIAFALRSARDESPWTSPTFRAQSLRDGRLVKDSSGAITGFATVKVSAEKGSASESSFALANGRWVKTETRPEGFLVATQSVHEAQ